VSGTWSSKSIRLAAMIVPSTFLPPMRMKSTISSSVAAYPAPITTPPSIWASIPGRLSTCGV
jgi:hypothetical protein